jgi:hypothetical protein
VLGAILALYIVVAELAKRAFYGRVLAAAKSARRDGPQPSLP